MSKKAAATKADTSNELRANEKKWGKNLMAGGWSAVPSVIIANQQGLGLDPVDLNIVLHLIDRWWIKEQLPFPSVSTIANAIGRSPRTVRRRVEAMEQAGLIRRISRRRSDGGHRSNDYDLSGLIEAAEPYAIERAQKKKEKAAAAKNRPGARLSTQKRLELIDGGNQ